MYLVVVIIPDKKLLPDLMKAWQKIGVPGGTILRSAGLYQTTSWLSELGLGALDRIFDRDEGLQRTIIVAVESEELLDALSVEADRVVGGFQNPRSGVLFVLPIQSARGLMKLKPRSVPNDLTPPPLSSNWKVRRDTLVKYLPDFMKLRPTIVNENILLDEVACKMVDNPANHVVCVVNEESRLIGAIDLTTLADDLFFRIFPEEFLSELTDLEHLMDFAEKSKALTAKDAMRKPVWVKESDTVKEAFKRMHENKLSGLPIVDDSYRVKAYINLLTLLSHCVEENKRKDAEEGNPSGEDK